MTNPERPTRCYRDRNNGVYFQREQHRHDCTDTNCRGCTTCTNHHCTATNNCTWHINPDQQTCGRCLATTRRHLRQISDLEALMLPAAITAGINSEAANLAGPGANYDTFSARRTIDKHWIQLHIPTGHQMRAMANLIPDDDEHHPHIVLTRWATMIATDYGHQLPERLTSITANNYLDRNLHRIAQDPDQDFALLGRELRKCHQHLESVIQNDGRPDRGAPCPDCTNPDNGVGPRLIRQYGHWCDDEGCERIHSATESDDLWQCPKVTTHRWTHEAYTRWIEDRRRSA